MTLPHDPLYSLTFVQFKFVAMSSGYSVFEWLLFAAYVFVAIVSLSGNSFLLYVIYVRKRFSNTFALIANQCISDAVCGVIYFSLWFICSSATVSWGKGVGAFVCDSVTTVKVSTFFVSAYTMMFISLDRCIKLHYPRSKGLRAKMFIPVTWALGIATAILNAYNFEIALFFTPKRLVACRTCFPTELTFFKQRFNYLLTYILILINFSITFVAYWKVIVKVKERKLIGSGSDLKIGEIEKAKRKTTHMLVASVVSYFLLCAPLYHVLLVDAFLFRLMPTVCGEATVYAAWYYPVYFCAVFTTCINPFIIGYYSRDFRQQFMKVLRAIRLQNSPAEGKFVERRSVGTNTSSSLATRSE